jgi:signal transduction histidine kinase
MPTDYPINSTVSVHITRAIPPGLLGRVVDGPKAIVRTREIAWGEPRPAEEYIGQTRDALVIGYNPAYEELELSLRLAERDPWQRIEERYPVGAEVDGRVIGLVERAAFVELEPGVEGFLPISELAPFHVEQIEDWLWIDDEVKALVTRIDPPRRRLGLSIQERVRARDARARREMWASYRETPSDNITLAELIPTETRLQLLRLDEPKPAALEPQLRVLIIEDDETYAEGLNSFLRRRGCEVTWAADGARGMSAVHAAQDPFHLVLLDWNLPGAKGDQLVERLQQECDASRLAMVLEPAPLGEQPGMLDALREMGVDVFSKEDGERLREGLLSILQDIRSDHSDRTSLRSYYFPDKITRQTAEYEAAGAREGGPGLAGQRESLREVLERLQRNARSDAAAVLRLDAGQHRLATEAAAGRPFPIEQAGPDLIYSPLGDVVQKGELIHEKVTRSPKKYQRLLDLLPFEGFLGVPLPPVGAVQYGLVLLRERGGFGRAARQEAEGAAYLIAALLQQGHLSQLLLVWQAQNLVGRMVSSVVHEINNKLGAIQFLIEDVQGGLRELSRWPDKAGDATFMRNLEGAAEAIARAQGEAHELRDQYLNLTASDDPQDVDLAALASSIAHVLRVEAQQHNVTLDVTRAPNERGAPDLPPVYARPSRIRQILMNLTLNAIQHVAALRRHGRLTIELAYHPQADLPLQARFTDDGPGIHRRQWERIFEFGFTTKKDGAGLGLTISRHAAESLGGRLTVESSYILWGTTFLLELPGGNAQ